MSKDWIEDAIKETEEYFENVSWWQFQIDLWKSGYYGYKFWYWIKSKRRYRKWKGGVWYYGGNDWEKTLYWSRHRPENCSEVEIYGDVKAPPRDWAMAKGISLKVLWDKKEDEWDQVIFHSMTEEEFYNIFLE